MEWEYSSRTPSRGKGLGFLGMGSIGQVRVLKLGICCFLLTFRLQAIAHRARAFKLKDHLP
jgi:hypothetical protein